MAAVGDGEWHVLGRKAGRVFRGMLGLPPEGCWLCLLPLSVGNRSGVGLATTPASGCLGMEVVIPARSLFLFPRSNGAEFTARVFLVPPCPAPPAFCRDEVSPFAGFSVVLWGKGRALRA